MQRDSGEWPAFGDRLSPSSDDEDYEEYLRQQRDEFVETTQARLETLDHELGRLNQQARDTENETRIRWDETWQDLKDRRRAAHQCLQDILNQPAPTWHRLVPRVDSVRQDLAVAIARARDDFRMRR